MITQDRIIAPPRKNSAFKQLMSIHWAMFYCYIILFLGGLVMARLPGDFGGRSTMYNFHKSMGVLTMGLLLWRILTLLQVWWKKYTKRSPKFTQKWIEKFVLHTILYFFMVAVPISGFFLSNSFKSNNVSFFGITLPDLFPENSSVVELGGSIHFWLAYSFGMLLILHAIHQRKVVHAWWRRTTS